MCKSLLLTIICSAAMLAAGELPTNHTTMDTTCYTEISDYEAIRHTIGLYLEGCAQGKSSIMKPAFHDGATMYWTENGELKGGPIQILFDVIDSAPGAGDQAAVISSVVIEKDIAQARVETDKQGGPRYSDMFNLIKTKDGWKIISKVYHNHR